MKKERIWTAICECGKSFKRSTRHSKLCSECRDKVYAKRKKYNFEQMTEKQLLREIRKLINASNLKGKEQLIKLIKEYKTRE